MHILGWAPWVPAAKEQDSVQGWLVSGNPAGNKQTQVEKGEKKIHQLLNTFWVSKYFAWCELSPETWPGRVMEQGPGVAFYANLEG